MKTKTYPSGHTVTQLYDVAGDLSNFSGNLGDGTQRTYSTGLKYNAQGQMIREQFGTQTPLYHRRHFNARGQLFDVRLGTGNNDSFDGAVPGLAPTSWNRGSLRLYYSSSYNDQDGPTAAPQNNNGNLYRQDIFVPTSEALDSNGNLASWLLGVDYYSYDALNRLVSVDELPAASWVGVPPGSIGWLPQAYSQRYQYDRFGNRRLNTIGTWGIGINRKDFALTGASNRLDKPGGSTCSGTKSGLCYD